MAAKVWCDYLVNNQHPPLAIASPAKGHTKLHHHLNLLRLTVTSYLFVVGVLTPKQLENKAASTQ